MIMRRALVPGLLAVLLGSAAMAAGCGGGSGDTAGTSTSSSSSSGGGGPPITPAHTWAECQASDQAWVRRALFALEGRRAAGQAEVNALEDVITAIRAADRRASETTASEGRDLEDAKRVVARMLMTENAFRERWSDFLLDALHVNRIELKNQDDCYGPPNPSAFDDGSLAAYVRDHDPATSSPPVFDFDMGQLLSSALELDDLSVVYRANLFAMMHRPIDGANVDFEAMERIRRQDFGAVFSTAYVHRDLVCLGCHNSEFSVTYNQDPALNRHWAIPGLFEDAIYGASNGKHPPEEAAEKGPDDLRAYSIFRVADVADENGERPWGWTKSCGRFVEPQSDDPLGIDAFFGSIRSTPEAPARGLRASVWDVERSLRRGVDLLAAHGLRRGAGGKLADADEAFAYLVAENIVEKVWDEVVGHPLTIANYFPRTQVQRDILMALTEHFVASRFSLKTLLLDIVAHPVFNLKAPDEGCGVAPYELPNVFDPWTTSDNDLGKRGNSPADGVFAISSRPLVRSMHRALGWPSLSEYPGDDQTTDFEAAIGFFLKDAEPGFRGLDFQGRLVWESVYAACPDQTGGNDFIARLVTRAQQKPGSTVGDAVSALKDRLIGEPEIGAAEKADLAALVGGSLDATDLGDLDHKLRTVCGVLVSTPQLMLGGAVPKDTRTVPALTPPEVSYASTCAAVSQYAVLSGAAYTITCAGDKVTAASKK
ncbi:Hypothetical protein A7982_11270 [Minicystis rosea]|nr:Hypothetical protein A7982_11270 [Minicystis rosea]